MAGAAGGFFGSLGATAWQAGAGAFAKSAGGTIAFGALSGGVGAELTGGNFWQGAITGGIVSGLNHYAHSGDDGDPKPKTSKREIRLKADRQHRLTPKNNLL